MRLAPSHGCSCTLNFSFDFRSAPQSSNTSATRTHEAREETTMNLPQDALSILDRHIQRLEEALRLEKKRRNALVPISQIFTEILGTIFYLAANDNIPSTSFDESFDCLSPAIRYNFSAVCQDWRDASMDNPRIWRIITTSRPTWSKLVLTRSKASSLGLYALILDPGMIQASKLFEEVIRDHMPRIQELDVGVGHGVVYDGNVQGILEALPLSSPNLRILRIDIAFLENQTSNRPAIPSGKLADANLSTLYLKGCDMDWKVFFAASLTSLEIGPVYTPPTPTDFLTALGQALNLEVLSLNNALPIADVGLPNMDRSIVLARLRVFRILSSINVLSVWLGRFRIPSSATAEICTFTHLERNREDINRDQLSPLALALSLFFKIMTPTSSLRFLDLDISRTSIRRLKISGYQSYLHQPDSEPAFGLSIYGVDKVDATLAEIVPALPCSQLHSLSVALSAPISQKCWWELFGDIPLKRIVVDCEATEGLINALKPPTDNHVTKNGLSFLSLEELFLESPDFSNYSSPKDFEACLASRKAAGAALLKLTADGGFGLTAGNVEQLRAVVADVDWESVSCSDQLEDDYDWLNAMEGGYNPYDFNCW